MEEGEKCLDISTGQEPLFTIAKEAFITSPSLDQKNEKCVAESLSASIMDCVKTELEIYSPNTMMNSAEGEPKLVPSDHQEITTDCQETTDYRVPCIQQSTSGSVDDALNTQQQQEYQQETHEITPSEEFVEFSELVPATVADLSVNSFSVEGSSDTAFKIEHDQDYILPDEDSCDASYFQAISDSVSVFNQQYQESNRAQEEQEDESTTDTGVFSPETFFSSIPSFNKTRKKLFQGAEKQTAKSTMHCHIEPNVSYPLRTPGVLISKSHFALVRHRGYHGVPIAPKPDPSKKVSCYILVVPAPVYYEKFAPHEGFPVHQDQQMDMSLACSEPEQDKASESVTTPEVSQAPAQMQQLEPPELTPRKPVPPELTPRNLNPIRNTLLSTIMRVSPSPDTGSESSPLITVSTSSTPIQPLCGHRQQYVIVQGNNRHLNRSGSHFDRPSTPAEHDSHQPIYLQGLPPQGFRRHWKSKRDSSQEELNKRPLVPLFPKLSPSASQEATVPQIEKSPLTGIRNKQPSEREVPDGTTTPIRKPATSHQDSPQGDGEITDTPCKGHEESDHQVESGDLPEDDTSETPTRSPTSGAKQREDKEKKKQRERRYEAALKEGFENLRHVVPGIQRSYSRTIILQETARHIENLRKEIEDAKGSISTHPRYCTTDNTRVADAYDTEAIRSEMISKELSGADISQFVEDGIVPHELNSSDGTETDHAAVRSMLVDPEAATVAYHSYDPSNTTVEEMPLSIPFQQMQNISWNPKHLLPYIRSPEESPSQEPLSRFIPLVEVPGYTEGNEHLGVSYGAQISPHRDVLLSAMTTISQEGLTNLGVTLSPLLSPQGIFLSPGGYPGGESMDEDVVISNVLPGLCTDMTSIAASVEVTTDKYSKWKASNNGKQRRSPRFRNKGVTAQTVPCVSPGQISDPELTSPRCRNRRVLQDSSNLKDQRLPLAGGEGSRRKRLQDTSPRQRYNNADENSAGFANQSRTPPGRVSDVILSRRRKTSPSPSTRGRGVTKRLRRV